MIFIYIHLKGRVTDTEEIFLHQFAPQMATNGQGSARLTPEPGASPGLPYGSSGPIS